MLRLNLSGFLLTAVSSSVFAAGFQLQEHSASGLGRAFAGETAIADNASAIGRNPALSASFSNSVYSAGFTYIDPSVDADGAVINPQLGLTTGLTATQDDYAPQAWVPNFYFLTPLDEQVSIGLSLNSHFGLSTDLNAGFNASDVSDTAKIETININPSIAYKVSSNFSVGLGVSLVYAEAELATTAPGYIPLANSTVVAKLEGDDWGYGWNAGLHWQASDDFHIGFNYRSEVEIIFEGELESDVSPATGDGTLAIDLPAGAELSFLYRLSPTWALSSSFNWTDWSVFDALVVDLDNVGELLLKEENYEDSWRYSLGVTHRLSDTWTLRAGLALDETPVQREFRSLSIPDSDRNWYTLGATYSLDNKFSADIGLAVLQGSEVSVEETSALGTQFVGTTSGDANILSVSVNYTF